MKNKLSFYGLAAVAVISSMLLTGCAPLLIAGGAVGGYAVAKNASDDSSIAKKK